MKAKVVRGSGFEGALQYVFHGRKHEHRVKKNAKVISSMMSGQGIAGMAAEFANVANLRTDIKKPVWHTSLSLPAGERLSDEKWKEIVHDFLTIMMKNEGKDLANYQYIAVQHGDDTDFQHVHIILNRVGLDKSVWLGQWEAKTAIAATQALELKHRLTITKGLDDAQKLDFALTDGEQQKAKRLGTKAARLELATLIRNARKTSTSLGQFVAQLNQHGINLAPNGPDSHITGASFEYQGTCYKGSEIGKDLGWKALSAAINYNPATDTELVAQLRANHELVDQKEATEVEIAVKKTVYEEVCDGALEQLFGKAPTASAQQFEGVLAEVKTLFPDVAVEVERSLRTQLKPIGANESATAVMVRASTLKRESEMILDMQMLLTDTHHELSKREINEAIAEFAADAKEQTGDEAVMSPEQLKVVRAAFESGYTNLNADDGMNPKFVLGCLAKGYESQDYQVFGVGIAKGYGFDGELDAGIDSRTMAKFLSDIKFKRIALDRKSVVVIEDVAKMSPEDMARLIDLTTAAGAKLVTTGYDRQFELGDGRAPTDGKLVAQTLMTNDQDYLVKTFGTGPDAEKRLARNEYMSQPMEDEDAPEPIQSYEDALKHGVNELFDKDSVITMDRYAEAMGELDELAPAYAARARAEIFASLEAVGLDDNGQVVFTTQAILHREVQMVKDARMLRSDKHHDLSIKEITAAITKQEFEASARFGKPVSFTLEQKAGVTYTMSGGFASLQGSAGSGKSFAMAVVKIGYQDKGYTVLGAASSKKAAQGLEDSTGIESFTIAKLLKNIQNGKVNLNQKTCLVIDEAGQVSVGDMSRLTKLCAAHGAKLVITGEDKQIDAVQHGGALRLLSRDDVVGTARIETIQRQSEAWTREAVANYRDGKMAAGYKAYKDRGFIILKGGGIDATLDALVERWKLHEVAGIEKQKADPSSKKHESLIITHSNASAQEIGKRVREFRKELGLISGPEYTIACAHGERKSQITLAAGDRIRFNKNDEGTVGVINGTSGTILSVELLPGSPKGNPDYQFRVMTDDRGIVEFRKSDYADDNGRLMVSQAYATTVYSSQGMTVDGDVFLLQTASMGRSNTYVANSRAKRDTYTFADKEALEKSAKSKDPSKVEAKLIEMMGREKARKMAVEHLAEADANYIKNTFGEMTPDQARLDRFTEVVKVQTEDETIREQFRQEELAKKDKGTFITTEVRPGILAPATSAKSPSGGPMPLARPGAMEPAKSNAARSGNAPRPS